MTRGVSYSSIVFYVSKYVGKQIDALGEAGVVVGLFRFT